MSYCRPRWVSDWMYIRFEARVRMISAMAPAGPPATAAAQGAPERSLLGYVAPGEKANWGVVAERVVDARAPMTGQQHARLTLADGRELMVPASVNVMSDGVTRELGVSLPAQGTVSRAEVFIDGQSFPVTMSAPSAP
jgi:hypothetical protein